MQHLQEEEIMKKLIGIVPKGILYDPEGNTSTDIYTFGNNYAKRILEAGALPVTLAPVDGRLPQDALEKMDGFLAVGGSTFWPYHFQTIHHAVENGKSFLGTCLGMQLIHCYFCTRDLVEARGYQGDLGEAIIDTFFGEDLETTMIEKVQGHMSEKCLRGEEDKVKHDVSVVPGTRLEALLGRQTARGASYHNWRVHDVSPKLTVNAYATDGTGTIEGIEYNDRIIGVQFHPEVDALLPEIYKFLAE